MAVVRDKSEYPVARLFALQKRPKQERKVVSDDGPPVLCLKLQTVDQAKSSSSIMRHLE